MEYRISDKMKAMKPSAIREIFKYAGDPSVISLAAGDPAPESLPLEKMKGLIGEIAEQDLARSLLYSQSEGHPPFRAALKEYLSATYQVGREFDELIVTTGAQQCMDLTCKVLCNEGDTVICDDPTFIGSLNTFRSYGVNLVGIPIEEDGMSVEQLEQALKDNPNTRFLYLIPNFQNPTGITMSMEKRRAIYELAKGYGVLILEDNPYGDLRFAGEGLPTIKSMDTEGIVVYAGSFSKILSTGIRVGYLVAPKELMAKLVVAKQCTDVHTSMLAQLLCHRFLTEEDMSAHIQSLKGVYARKCGLMLAEMERRFPPSMTWTKPQGGLFIWADLPPGMDGAEFATRLVREKKVCVVPGTAFYTKVGRPSGSVRLNFSTPTDANIIKGIGLMAELLRDA